MGLREHLYDPFQHHKALHFVSTDKCTPSLLQTLTSTCALPVPTISGHSAALTATLRSQPSTDLTQPITLLPDGLDVLDGLGVLDVLGVVDVVFVLNILGVLDVLFVLNVLDVLDVVFVLYVFGLLLVVVIVVVVFFHFFSSSFFFGGGGLFCFLYLS